MLDLEIMLEGLEPAYKSRGSMRLRLIAKNNSDMPLEKGALHYQVLVGERVVRGVTARIRPVKAHDSQEIALVLVNFFEVSEAAKVAIQARVDVEGKTVAKAEWQTRLVPIL